MINKNKPLAERVRPERIDEFVGQTHLLAEDKVLHQLIKSKSLPSMIFWGPPGVGKTTLANIIAKEMDLYFFTLSAVDAGVKEVRKIIDAASKMDGAILFIDEIHRFNKSQQDALLHAVEKGVIHLIGATTENPSFEVISPLLSRCQVYILENLSKKELLQVLDQAMDKDEILKGRNIKIEESDLLLRYSGGDARKLLNLFELVVQTSSKGPLVITDELVKNTARQQMAVFDKSGEMHYDLISAYIKSIRGSDPNAALYYLARMIKGGEDPKFIARRLLILSAEDIGLANPTALVIANNCFQAVNVIGYPECELILSEVTTYLAVSPKSNSTYVALKNAKKLVNQTGDLSVPLAIRNAPTKLMKDLDYGKEYKYAHDFSDNFTSMEFMPEQVQGQTLFEPANNPREGEIRKRLKELWASKYGY
ncbi:MAG: replication-associated recombination protein A [Chitinophagales bacterium]|nr:replication-associated recombination protein A [Chitinophagales bacterium]